MNKVWSYLDLLLLMTIVYSQKGRDPIKQKFINFELTNDLKLSKQSFTSMRKPLIKQKIQRDVL